MDTLFEIPPAEALTAESPIEMMTANGFWPCREDLTDCRTLPQVTNGKALCTFVAVCNNSFHISHEFNQCDRVHFFYEFVILEDSDSVLFAGAEISNVNGIVIHGQNSSRYPDGVCFPCRRGSRIRVHQWMDLQVKPGEYQLTLGLAGSEHQAFEDYVKGDLTYANFGPGIREYCRLNNAFSLQVGFTSEGKLSHHGLTGIPGEFEAWQEDGGAEPPYAPPAEGPSIFHVTHWKAGSQWIHKILQQAAPDRVVAPLDDSVQVRYHALRPGCVYPTVYLAKDDFDRVCLPPDSRVFVVIRDLRDTLVSAYFSFKISHSIQFESQRRLRETLCSLDKEEGLWYLMENGMAYCAKIQLSWLEAGATILKYEDLLENDVALLEETLIGHCGLAVDPSTLREIVLRNRFDVLTAGRQRGTEDRTRHERRGVAGDWRNHFSEKLKKAFKARFGGVLVATGYEKDLNW